MQLGKYQIRHQEVTIMFHLNATERLLIVMCTFMTVTACCCCFVFSLLGSLSII